MPDPALETPSPLPRIRDARSDRRRARRVAREIAVGIGLTLGFLAVNLFCQSRAQGRVAFWPLRPADLYQLLGAAFPAVLYFAKRRSDRKRGRSESRYGNQVLCARLKELEGIVAKGIPEGFVAELQFLEMEFECVGNVLRERA